MTKNISICIFILLSNTERLSTFEKEKKINLAKYAFPNTRIAVETV